MATLTYWYAHCLGDHQCYSIIGKTRKDVAEQVTKHGGAYGDPEKRCITYKDAFDLFEQVTGECGGRDWGWRPEK